MEWNARFAWDGFFTTLKELEFHPTYIIDVGANHGHWTRTALLFNPDAAVTMIEPQGGLKADVDDLLQRPNIEWITAGAGAENRTMPLTIAPFDHSSTFVISAENAARLGLKQVEVPVYTLNHIVGNNGGRIPELVKIDAEGFDLKVIEGASDLIGKTEIFLLEAGVLAGGIENTITRTIKHMDELGYQPFDITDLNYSPAQHVLWLVEIVFVKKGGLVISKTTPNY